MTNAETIENLMTIKNIYTWSSGADEALDIAIQILKATQSVSEKCKGCVEFIECADLLNMPLGHSCEDCISRAEALRHRHIIYDDDGVGYSVVRVDEIEQLPSVTPQQTRWIPCSERLPEVGSEVLVCFDFKGNRSVYISDFYGDGEFHGLDDEYLTPEGRKCRKAVAWMPLPQPYTESEEKE